MKSKFYFLLLPFLLAPFLFKAQSYEFPEFKRQNPGEIIPLVGKNKIEGYAMLHIEKSDENFYLSAFNENLELIKTISLDITYQDFLNFGITYNGSLIGFYFYEKKSKSFKVIAYDKALKKVATVTRNKDSAPGNVFYVSQVASGMGPAHNSKQERLNEPVARRYDMSLFPVEGTGFLLQGLLKNEEGMVLEMLDNKLQTKWTYVTPKDGKGPESFLLNQVTDKYILGTLIRRPVLSRNSVTYSLLVFDLATGEKKMEIPMESKVNDHLELTNVWYDDGSKKIFAIGEYDVEPTVLNDQTKSKGFYIKTFEESGKQAKEVFYSWDDDVRKKLSNDEFENFKKRTRNYVHTIITGTDGKIYLVCEQFKENYGKRKVSQFDGATGKMEYKEERFGEAVIGNMLIYVLNRTTHCGKSNWYPRKTTMKNLPPIFSDYEISTIGIMSKMLGNFDYLSTQSTDGKNFVISYVDKSTGNVGNISLSAEGKFKVTSLPIKPRPKFESDLYPAKDGFIMKVEYSKKEDKASMDLLKITP
jgi:hypothetical protein